MFGQIDSQQEFLKKYNITEESFRKSCLTWQNLTEIADHFESQRSEYLKILQEYASVVQQCSDVHSLSFRLKDTEHLIEKIIRKNVKYFSEGKMITKDNYADYITDLMGIRVLLLFKEDWNGIHEFLIDKYKSQFVEDPFVYIRKGDDESFYKGKIEIKAEKPYRSAHYVIRHANGVGLEIQVRTLFEEAWSEIDHKIRYPYNMGNEMINSYLEIMNRAAGMADEMGTFIHGYIRSFERLSYQGRINDNSVYNYILDRISDCEDKQLKDDIEEKICQAENFRKMILMSDALEDILRKI